MNFRAFKIRFVAQNGMMLPVVEDRHLHKLAVEWAEKNLDCSINLADYPWVEIVCSVNENDEPIEVFGMICGHQPWDFPVCRYTEPEAGKVLFDRVNGTLHDLGLRGQEVLIILNPHGKVENLCPERNALLKQYKAERSYRWSVIVR